MGRKLAAGQLIVASHNTGKVREIAALLGAFDVLPVSASAMALPEPEETGTTFIANAALKALAAAQTAGVVAIADDSGLCVDALNGEPGIYSARWAGPTKNFEFAMEAVQGALDAVGPEASRAAHFVCALSLAWPDGHVESFEGRISGTLVWPPRGALGFGYDPMFVPDGQSLTFGEMSPADKHAMSHRAIAFKKLVSSAF